MAKANFVNPSFLSVELGLAFQQGPTFINRHCQAAANLIDQDSGLTKQMKVLVIILKHWG